MKIAFSNSVCALALLFALSTVLRGQGNQTPTPQQEPPSTQPQNEPAQPSQTQPQQEPPKEQPPAQPPNGTQPQAEPEQPGQAPPDQGQSKEAPQTQPSQATPSTEPPAAPKPKPRAAKSKSTKKRTPATKTQPTTQDGKVVVRNGGARESTTQISPGVDDQQAQHQRDVTSQLLATTDANLKKASAKQLTPSQQSMLDQVNSYVRQSKAASDAGDISRAHTFAVKAQLLSNELARR